VAILANKLQTVSISLAPVTIKFLSHGFEKCICVQKLIIFETKMQQQTFSIKIQPAVNKVQHY